MLEVKDHLSVASDSAGVRLDDAEGERNRHGCIDDVASLLQNLDACRGRQWVSAGYPSLALPLLLDARTAAHELVYDGLELCVRGGDGGAGT
jgi:hypothetical protein